METSDVEILAASSPSSPPPTSKMSLRCVAVPDSKCAVPVKREMKGKGLMTAGKGGEEEGNSSRYIDERCKFADFVVPHVALLSVLKK